MTLRGATHEVSGRPAASAGRPLREGRPADGAAACGPERPRGLPLAWDWIRRLAPSLVLFSLFFAFEDGLRWLGLLGLVPLALVLLGGSACGACGRDGGHRPGAWPGAGA